MADKETDITKQAKEIYLEHAKKSTEELMEFIATIGPEPTVCVTYFDEAGQLSMGFWIMLRLLSNQDKTTAMWYVFMATKSSVKTFDPEAHESKCSLYCACIYL